MPTSILEQLKESVNYIQKVHPLKPALGITLGSGLSNFAKEIDIAAEIPYKDIPHFAPSSVDGHPGKLILGKLAGVPVVCLQGRIHYYEGHSIQQVVFPTRVLAKLGIQKLILTNAAGGLNPDMQPGDFMIISDHMNLMGTNPLIGPNINELGLRFPDMTEAYDRKMIEVAEKTFKDLKIRYHKGVYAAVSGPTYETAAEVCYLGKLGASAVGMSTVPETIVAKHMGLKVAGFSCISNLACGLSSSPITHDEVKEVTAKVEKSFAAFLKEFIKRC